MYKDYRFMPTDYNKFKKAVSDKNLTCARIARELGFCESYFKDMSDRKKLRQSVIIQLENIYGIKYDDIKPDEPKSDEPKLQESAQVAQTVQTSIDIDSVKSAVADAIKNIDYNAFREMMAYAVETAIRNVLTDKGVQMQLATWLTRVNSDGWKMAWRDKLEQQAEANRRMK